MAVEKAIKVSPKYSAVLTVVIIALSAIVVSYPQIQAAIPLLKAFEYIYQHIDIALQVAGAAAVAETGNNVVKANKAAKAQANESGSEAA